MKCAIYVADGPCLIHSNTGDLLRSLDPPDADFKCPKFIALTREGYILVNYDRGALVSYGINGKTLRHVAHNDNVQVSSHRVMRACCEISCALSFPSFYCGDSRAHGQCANERLVLQRESEIYMLDISFDSRSGQHEAVVPCAENSAQIRIAVVLSCPTYHLLWANDIKSAEQNYTTKGKN